NFRAGSLETILSGGISFGIPEGILVGSPINGGSVFKLYPNYSDTLKKTYEHGTYFVVSFKQNLGGLTPGAPVQYRGITIGRVERILLKEMVAQVNRSAGSPIPVLIYIEPGRLQFGDTLDANNKLSAVVEKGVKNGLRATLASGNLLTGSLLVSLDYYPEEEKAELGTFNQYKMIPSVSSGLEQIQYSVAQFLKKLNALLSSEYTKNLPVQINGATTALNHILSSKNMQEIPTKLASVLESLKKTLDGLAPHSAVYDDLDNTLYKLNDALQGIEELTKSLSNVSSILPSADVNDPEPEVTK
ncbi:MAG TPA: MCE family protein, partial [Gammaproteobacteria bacterium]|nr:MCE family protein [Gammaproteobacteria bacterium]